MSTTKTAPLNMTMMASLFATREHIITSLKHVARDDGKTNTITLKADPDFDDEGDLASEDVVVLVNGRVGFGTLVDVEDPDRPGEDVASGNVLGFPLVGDWRTIRAQVNALFAFITADLDGEWELDDRF